MTLSTSISVPLTRGLFALVSIEDAQAIAPYKWHAVPAKSTHYAARRAGNRTIYMHRLLAGVLDMPRQVFVDHIDFDGLNNTRANLQVCSAADNVRKSRTRRVFSASKGVWQVRPGCFAARIVHEGSDHYLGVYPSEREAAIAYDAAATVLFGRFAVKNFQ